MSPGSARMNSGMRGSLREIDKKPAQFIGFTNLEGLMIYQQSVFEPWPIESESVQALITSPPYYALRKYSIPDVIIGGDKDCKHEFELKDMELGHENRQGKGSNTLNQSAESHIGVHGKKVGQQGFCIHCNAWKGQYGLEPTPQMYVEHTRLWAKEAWRVLRNDGIMFLNLADSYAGSGGAGGDYNKGGLREGQEKYKQNKINYPSKCQLLIPHRVAIALVDDGWTLRNTICWFKSNAMPESVTDRFSKKYEYVFMFTKQEKYYFDLDVVKEKANMETQRGKSVNATMAIGNIGSGDRRINYEKNRHKVEFKNPGDVWQIPTQPSSEKHFAMWPERLVERMVKCSTKAGDIVLDPFAGSGTTLKVAEQLHRKGVGIELGYESIHRKRLSSIQKRLII